MERILISPPTVTITITEKQSTRPIPKFIVTRLMGKSFVELRWRGTTEMGWYTGGGVAIKKKMR